LVSFFAFVFFFAERFFPLFVLNWVSIFSDRQRGGMSSYLDASNFFFVSPCFSHFSVLFFFLNGL